MQTAGVLLLVAAASSSAQVTMSLVNPNDGAPGDQFCEYAGISATLNNSTLITAGADWIGIYEFDVEPNSTPSISSPFYSVCLSPGGNLPAGDQVYDAETFAQANPGLNAPGTPGSWAYSGTSYYGVENANYLFALYSTAITAGDGQTMGLSGSEADQGAALAMGMYAALYNSTAYGTLGGSAFVNTSTAENVNTDYNDILETLNGSSAVATAVQGTAGEVLVPENSGSQEFDFAGGGPPIIAPEPDSVILASLGSLLLAAWRLLALRRRL